MTFRGARAAGGRLTPRRRGFTARLPLVALAALILAGLVGPLGQTAAAARDEGVHTLTGTVTIENPWIIDSRTDPYVLLQDLTDLLGNPRNSTPVSQQILAGIEGDVADEAAYTLSLPIAPKGGSVDVSDTGDGGVQIYWVQLISDALGDPFFGPLDGAGATPASSFQFDVWTTSPARCWSGA